MFDHRESPGPRPFFVNGDVHTERQVNISRFHLLSEEELH